VTLLWQEGWTRWPTEVPSNPYYSVILWFCESTKSLPAHLSLLLHHHQGQPDGKVCTGCLTRIAALASGVSSVKRSWKLCHQFSAIKGANTTVHVAIARRKILKKCWRARVKSSPALILRFGAARSSALDSEQTWNRFLAAGSSKQGHILLQSRSLWNQGTSQVISTLHTNMQLLGKLCANRGWLRGPPQDRLHLTLCSGRNLWAHQFTCSYQIVLGMVPWLLLLLIVWCDAKITQIIVSLREATPKCIGFFSVCFKTLKASNRNEEFRQMQELFSTL